jgi:Cu+-exporting ATPase
VGLEEQGKHHDADLFFTEDASLQACVYLSRPEYVESAKELLQSLRSEGISTVLLSGDREENCKRVANELGIENYYAEQKPDQKLQRIEEMQKTGPVLFVGDGVNDGPALAAADVGIAVGGAQAISVHAADVALLRPGLSGIRDALSIGKASMSTIRQNLFWAFAYNTAAIPLAMAGFLSPGWAALAMALSDVCVIGNSLRLRGKKGTSTP